MRLSLAYLVCLARFAQMMIRHFLLLPLRVMMVLNLLGLHFGVRCLFCKGLYRGNWVWSS